MTRFTVATSIALLQLTLLVAGAPVEHLNNGVTPSTSSVSITTGDARQGRRVPQSEKLRVGGFGYRWKPSQAPHKCRAGNGHRQNPASHLASEETVKEGLQSELSAPKQDPQSPRESPSTGAGYTSPKAFGDHLHKRDSKKMAEMNNLVTGGSGKHRHDLGNDSSDAQHLEARAEKEQESPITRAELEAFLAQFSLLNEEKKNGEAINLKDEKHKRDLLEDELERRDLYQRDWDDYELEARSYLDFDELDELD